MAQSGKLTTGPEGSSEHHFQISLSVLVTFCWSDKHHDQSPHKEGKAYLGTQFQRAKSLPWQGSVAGMMAGARTWEVASSNASREQRINGKQHETLKVLLSPRKVLPLGRWHLLNRHKQCQQQGIKCSDTFVYGVVRGNGPFSSKPSPRGRIKGWGKGRDMGRERSFWR